MIKVRPADKKDVFIQEAKDGDTAYITGKGYISASNFINISSNQLLTNGSLTK